MKHIYKIYVIFLILLTVGVTLFARGGEIAGLYSHTSEDANGDLQSWLFSFQGSGNDWEASMVVASPDGSQQQTLSIQNLVVEPQGLSLTFTMEGVGYTGQFVETEEGRMSLVLVGGGKMLTFIR
jgi:hypothetical protein